MLKKSFSRSIAASIILCGMATFANAEWFPYPAETTKPAFAADGVRSPLEYVPLEKAQKKWNICVSLPHMKDAYWLGVDYGAIEEGRRQGVAVNVLEAGGYTNLNKQISQIEDCVARGAQAVVIGAISADGLAGLVDNLAAKNIPTIDVVNGINSSKLTAKSLVSFYVMGQTAGEYLVSQHPSGSAKVKIGWFPGPAGAGWVEAAHQGFTAAVKASDAIEVLPPRYGDTGKEAQATLIEDVLQVNPDISYVAGTAVTAEVGVGILKARGLADKIKLLPFYMTPGVYDGIANGTIIAASADSMVIQAKIAIDQAVRALEGNFPPEYKHVGPKIIVIDSESIKKVNREDVLPPRDFRPVFNVR